MILITPSRSWQVEKAIFVEKKVLKGDVYIDKHKDAFLQESGSGFEVSERSSCSTV